ncbi:DEAD/DEAH box helicase family protein [Erysipelothrix rhusiopathiae]|uniref:DEAD/DEAH box helicase family protein n=1 Tax=Erysipelothrix rhusiopathiae TaxID=1648 RepID=UPI002953047E|nr:DEAD/DEAH box helicase family protein [Erysipelothrix rhusiopathiae]MDV7679704.1 DEAD/DEAH box helicase family protein [Erysipelothrix rhusiopathiae]
MGFDCLKLKYSYRSENDNIAEDFYIPCLKESIMYDRAAGYFSSNVLENIAEGLVPFISKNEGKIRIVANPYLSFDDLNAMQLGYEAREKLINAKILDEIIFCKENLENNTLNILSWLIYQEKLEIKIAYSSFYNLYHEKFGIMKDSSGNSISFIGSANESLGGISNNFEKIEVFSGKFDGHRIDTMSDDFERLWSNRTKGLEIIQLSDPVIAEILKCRETSLPTSFSKAKDVNASFTIREYQFEAIQNLKNNNWRGVFDMATGTGKTITSIFSFKEFSKIFQQKYLHVIVPYIHLADQWVEELKKFGYTNILKCYGSINLWRDQLQSSISRLNSKIIDELVIVSVYNTASGNDFSRMINNCEVEGMVVCDECHYLGSDEYRKINLENFSARLGLSATPQRWYDEVGTSIINEKLGDVVFSYTLKEAIQNNKLCEYEYIPIIVRPTFEEIEKYKKLSQKLSIELNKKNKDVKNISRIARLQSEIVNKSEEKVKDLFIRLGMTDKNSLSHTLIYVSNKQIKEITMGLSKLNIRAHKFDHTMSAKKRKKILKNFADGEIQVLIAIKCLDEGIDIPAARTVFFLSSTSNPREFIQRRGRVLRLHEGKDVALIYDYIVLPLNNEDNVFAKYAKKQFPRYSEFMQESKFPSRANILVYEELKKENLMYIMFKKPWEIYMEQKEKYDE